MSAVSGYVRVNTHGQITLSNGAGTISLVLLYDRGDVKIAGLSPMLNEHRMMSARGKHLSDAYGARKYPTISFSAYVTELISADGTNPGSMLELLSLLGAHSTLEPVSGVGRPAAINFALRKEGSNFGRNDETVTCTNVYWEWDYAEAEDGDTLSLTGTVMGSVVITDGANTVTYSEVS